LIIGRNVQNTVISFKMTTLLKKDEILTSIMLTINPDDSSDSESNNEEF